MASGAAWQELEVNIKRVGTMQIVMMEDRSREKQASCYCLSCCSLDWCVEGGCPWGFHCWAFGLMVAHSRLYFIISYLVYRADSLV